MAALPEAGVIVHGVVATGLEAWAAAIMEAQEEALVVEVVVLVASEAVPLAVVVPAVAGSFVWLRNPYKIVLKF